jgi:hypothetical protein
MLIIVTVTMKMTKENSSTIDAEAVELDRYNNWDQEESKEA